MRREADFAADMADVADMAASLSPVRQSRLHEWPISLKDQDMPAPAQPDVILRNNVKVAGRGDTPMLFAHGFGCDQNMWRFVAPEFERSHRVVLFDHVGAGSSDVSAYDRRKYATLDGYATDVLDICRELQLSDVVFVGHSVSAMIGVLAAGREPDRFKALVLVGPSAR